MLTHPTHDRLVALGLTGMAKALEEQRQQPDIAALSFEERLALMVDREAIVLPTLDAAGTSWGLTDLLEHDMDVYPGALAIEYRCKKWVPARDRGLDYAPIATRLVAVAFSRGR
jgi:hypothetical protein